MRKPFMKIQNSVHAPVFKRSYGHLKLLCGGTRTVMESEKADLKLLEIEAGLETSHHRHLQRESIFHVISGNVLLRSVTANVERELVNGDTFLIAPGEDHVLKNIGRERATVLEIESPPHSSSDKIPFETSPLPTESIFRPNSRFWTASEDVKLKICGIKNLDTAMECFRLGVDAIGLHAVGSRGLERVLGYGDWLTFVPKEMSIFVLTDTVDAPILHHLITHTSCDTIQLQGDHGISDVSKAAEHVRSRGCRFVRTVSAGKGADETAVQEQLSQLQPLVDGILFDSGSYGGTGTTHDWSLRSRLTPRLTVPVIMAGGLTAENCAEAIMMTQPHGLDVESGVEDHFKLNNMKRITVKNFAKVNALIRAIRQVYKAT